MINMIYTICWIIAFGLVMGICEVSAGHTLAELPFTGIGNTIVGILLLICLFVDVCQIIGYIYNVIRNWETPSKPDWYYYDSAPFPQTDMTSEDVIKARKAVKELLKEK